jgi:hypothetical protein
MIGQDDAPNLHDLITVTWLDSTGDVSDHSFDTIQQDKPYYCKRITAGFFISQDPEFIVFCADLTLIHGNERLSDGNSKNSSYNTLLAVPMGMVISLRVAARNPLDT